jgi:hypothetical protein
MPKSATAKELLAQGKLYYGDPCYDSTFGSTKEECERVTNGDSLAHAVLAHYGIEISDDWPAPEESCCCPLDILNQDPVQCIKMSLMSSLLQEEYWEVYADEYGKARFVQLLPEAVAKQATLPRVQYCVPSLQMADIANLVVVRSADPPPFRKCGKLKIPGQADQDWYDVIDGNIGVLREANTIFPVTPGQTGASDARGIMFNWGEVTGYSSTSTDATCEHGKFNQFGSIVYPDYERKQIYNDGVVDLFELGGFEQILFWLTDISFGNEELIRHYSIQFVKSSDVPVHLEQISVSDLYKDEFGVTCDTGAEGGTGTDPNMALSYAQQLDLADKSCTSVQAAVGAAKERRQAMLNWMEFSAPSFYGYGWTKSEMSFHDYSKWNIVEADKCLDNPIDNLYESTSNLWANASSLDKWGTVSLLDCNMVNFGQSKGKRTMDIPQQTVWTEIRASSRQAIDEYKIMYALRSQAPSNSTFKTDLGVGGTTGWQNPFYNYMMQYIDAQHASNCSSVMNDFRFVYPGYLFGWDDGLYLVHELWAKIKVARPGIAIQGFGRGVDSFLPNIRMRVKPVYQVDFPAAVAAAGENWPLDGGADGCVDVYKDLAMANHSYCEELETESSAEKLQEAMSGTTIDITLPFLFPDYKAVGQFNPSDVKDKSAFTALCDKCNTVARFLWSYVEKYKDEPHKSFTYVCGPPRTQAEVPRLGYIVETDYGPRTVQSIAYSYSDNSSFNVTIEVGPVSIASATAGTFTKKKTSNPDVKGKIVDQAMGALYKVDIPHLGIIKAWNIDKYPWDVGDKVTVTLYNHPMEL